MSGFASPLKDEDNPRYDDYHKPAWAAKRDGRPAAAIQIWQVLVANAAACSQMSYQELAALYQQMAVCWRLLWQHETADQLFIKACALAHKAEDMRLLCSIRLDQTAGWLDKGQAYRAVRLLEAMRADCDETDDQYAVVQAYLGRAYGCLGDGQRARQHLLQAIGLLEAQPDQAELLVDVLIWLQEIRFWRGRREWYVKARETARRVAPARVKDARLTYLGGRPIRRLLRRLMSAQYQLRK